MPERLRQRRVRLVWLLSALLALAVVAGACGDDDDEGVAASAEGGAQTSTPAAKAPPPTLAPPAALKSFRYEMTMELSGSAASGRSGLPSGVSIDLDLKMEMSGAVISPDREQSTLKVDFGFLKLDVETIRIGDRVWTRQSGDEWQEETADLGELGLDFSVSPVDLLGADETGGGFETLRSVLGALDGENDRVNGIDAVRYELTSEQFTQAFPSGGLPGGLSEGAPDGALEEMLVQVWIARDSGIPVRLVMEASAGDGGDEGEMRLELNLSELNSSEIEIEPPA